MKHRSRRVVQLGLKGQWLQSLGEGDAVVRIERLDDLLENQRAILSSDKPHLLAVPKASPLDVGFLKAPQLKALHLVSESARPKLRILCLHGYLQNGKVFSRRTRQLSRKLKGVAELVYVDAPHLLAPEELPPPLPVRATVAGQSPKEHPVEDSNPEMEICEALEGLACPVPSPASSPPPRPEREEARAWWRCDAEERRRAKAMPGMAGRCKWKGLEESIAFLIKVWEQNGPFDGLLGFSQGAAMVSVFNHCAFGRRVAANGGSRVGTLGNTSPEGRAPSMVEIPDHLSPPKFAVFISGSYHPHPTQVPSYPLGQMDQQEALPSLHVWAVDDPFVPAVHSQRLAGMYLRPSVLMHRGSHCVPQKKDAVPHFVRFLEEFR